MAIIGGATSSTGIVGGVTSPSGGVTSMPYQEGGTREVLTRDIEEILERCDEDLLDVLRLNETRSFPPFTHCQICNMSQEEMDVLFYSGICTPSNFSYTQTIYLMYTSIFLLALLGNSLVLYTVASNRIMRTVTNLFIANLAIGDLLIMVLCVPLSVASIIVLQYWPFGEGLCIFVNYFQGVSIFVSAYTLVAISLDRYLAIIYPLRPRMTRLQAKVIIALVWGSALLTTLPIALFSRLDPTENRIYQSYGRVVCREMWPDESLRKSYTMTLMVLQYFLPLVVLIYTYSRIAWKVWGCWSSHTPYARQSLERVPALPSVETARSVLRKSTTDHSPAKMIRMTLTVVLVYSLCWLPFNLLLVVLDFVENVQYWPHFHHLWFVFHWLAMSHTCYSPLILCWMNTKFREGYLNVLYRLFPCCRKRISHYLLKLRRSSGLHRAQTYSTAFGSSRTSRNHRFSDEARRRRDSSCSTTGFIQLQNATEIPLKAFHTCPLQDPTINGLRHNLTRKCLSESHIHENGEGLLPSPCAAVKDEFMLDTNRDSRSRGRITYLQVPLGKQPEYLEVAEESRV